MTENCISLINAGLDKTAGQIQYRQFLNKGRVNREIAVPRKTFQGRQGHEPTKNPTRIWDHFEDSNLGHNGGSHCTALATKLLDAIFSFFSDLF